MPEAVTVDYNLHSEHCTIQFLVYELIAKAISYFWDTPEASMKVFYVSKKWLIRLLRPVICTTMYKATSFLLYLPLLSMYNNDNIAYNVNKFKEDRITEYNGEQGHETTKYMKCNERLFCLVAGHAPSRFKISWSYSLLITYMRTENLDW